MNCHEQVKNRQQSLEALFHQGVYSPILLHHFITLPFWPFLGLMLSRGVSIHSRPIRLFAFIGMASQASWMIQRSRTAYFGNGHLVGIALGCLLLRAATLLLLTDPHKEFRRIKRASSEDSRHNERVIVQDGKLNLRGGREPCRNTGYIEQQGLVWEPSPECISRRASWVASLITSPAGSGWNWRPLAMNPPLPETLRSELEKPAESQAVYIMDTERESAAARARLKDLLWTIFKAYMVLDIVLSLSHLDLYFQGHGTATNAIFHRFPLAALSARAYRSIVAATIIALFLNLAMTASQATMLTLALCLPRVSQAFSLSSPVTAAWFYEDFMGPFQSVLDNGIVGLWGTFWHQAFRLDYSSCARFVLSLLPEKIARSRPLKGLVVLVVAFLVSGLSHLPGSYMQQGTEGSWAELSFKLLQVPGVLLQQVVAYRVAPRQKVARRLVNCALVVAWLVFTGPFLVDEYARDGLFCMEAVPISLVNGLVGDGRWLRWSGFQMQMYWGRTWWESGLRVL